MKLKDVNTTDLYATDRGELARVVMTGQLWKRSSFDHSDFAFRHASGYARQGRVGEGYSALMIGHLAVVHHGQVDEADRRELAELELPALDADSDYETQRAAVEELRDRLEGTNLRLFVVNTQRMKLWADHTEAKRREYEAWERRYNEDQARRAAARDRFNLLGPALSVYGLGNDQLETMRFEAMRRAHNRETLSVTVTLDVLETLLADAALGREASGR